MGILIIASYLKQYYLHHDRNIVQYDFNCAQYDSVLSYRLKPGQCHFNNREFKTDLLINSGGLRDDQPSMVQPDIIVLGDSHAMGWGVKQANTFAQKLEKQTHLKVLNGAISSYGTAREMRLLQQLDTTHLKYLIIQYCSNDVIENKQFVESTQLKIMNEDKYNHIVHQHQNTMRYYFGKHTRLFIAIIKDQLLQFLIKKKPIRSPSEVSNSYEALLFSRILNQENTIPIRTQIIVMEINGNNHNDVKFIKELEKLKQTSTANNRLKTIITIDSSSFLNHEDYFIIDDHINNLGHQKITNQLLKIILSKTPPSNHPG